MRRYSGHKEPWGQFVDVKVNAAGVLAQQLRKAKQGTVWISSVCDPYQPLERQYQVTRQCLKVLSRSQFSVNIQTKSKLVLRDLDIFCDFEQIEVGFTIITDREEVVKVFEPGGSPVEERFMALARIHKSGIRTFAFIGPVLPGNPEVLVARLEGITDKVWIDKMNYTSSIRRFYHQQDLETAATKEFFSDYRQRLVDELTKRKMSFEVLF
jgi:DNA repair photolyase